MPRSRAAACGAPVLLSFGDGHHRYPGGPLAILESHLPAAALGRMMSGCRPAPVRWNPVSQGYDLDRFMVRLA